ncbi:MAG: transposase, partial [bacterium]
MIRYLGAYLKRGPISEKRVIANDGRTVRIAHKHPEEHEAEYYELTGEECVRRLLLHMPEPRVAHQSLLRTLPSCRAKVAGHGTRA